VQQLQQQQQQGPLPALQGELRWLYHLTTTKGFFKPCRQCSSGRGAGREAVFFDLQVGALVSRLCLRLSAAWHGQHGWALASTTVQHLQASRACVSRGRPRAATANHTAHLCGACRRTPRPGRCARRAPQRPHARGTQSCRCDVTLRRVAHARELIAHSLHLHC
jgi:hypothetical protein